MESNRLNNEAHEALEIATEATKKPFFKSNAFKCVMTLLCILLVSGIFLTIAHGFLEVTDAEREARAIEKIYGNDAKIEKTLDTSSYPTGEFKVEKGYVMSDGNYLIKTTGYGGYNGGSVTCWVVVKVTGGAVSGVGKVVIDGQTGQTLMSQYNDSTLDVFSKNYNGEEFDRSVITGATAKMTNGAITKTVNGSIAYVKSVLGGGGTADKTPFDDFKFTEYINKKATTVEFANGKLTYTVKTKEYGAAPALTLVIVVNNEKKIESFTVSGDLTQDYEEMGVAPDVQSILENRDISYFTGKYGEDMAYTAIASYDANDVTTGASTESIASNSTYLCMYAGAFATANYNKALLLGIKYTANINMSATTWTVGENDKVTYTVKTKEYGAAPALTLVIVVNNEKKIESFTVNGDLTQDYEEMGVAPAVQSILENRDISYFTGKYGEDMAYKAIASHDANDVTTGASTESIASNSTYLCMYAGAFATANYDIALLTGGNE